MSTTYRASDGSIAIKQCRSISPVQEQLQQNEQDLLQPQPGGESPVLQQEQKQSWEKTSCKFPAASTLLQGLQHCLTETPSATAKEPNNDGSCPNRIETSDMYAQALSESLSNDAEITVCMSQRLHNSNDSMKRPFTCVSQMCPSVSYKQNILWCKASKQSKCINCMLAFNALSSFVSHMHIH